MRLSAVRHYRHCLAGLALLCIGALPAHAAAPAPPLRFSVFARTGVALSGVLWTGSAFLYTVEGGRAIYATDASGAHLRVFATVPQNNGEMRCILSPGAHGFPARMIYCHAAQGQIYRISADGHTITQVAMVPTPHGSDGALTYDATGMFGSTLLAATGGSDAGPGVVYTVQPGGQVRQLGAYAGPGGAENIAIAPPGFGAVAGQVLITIDKHDHQGRLLAMDAHGAVRTLVQGLPWGLNSIAAIPADLRGAAPGSTYKLYLADWRSHTVLVAPAGPLQAFAGDLFVATERRHNLYVVRPQGSGYSLTSLQTNLPAPDYNFEGACFVAG
ncbi:MAG TPA: hypothetical protein VHB98_15680 [Chloroflexota bacterium]|nr:hypothetical protein [Chloroflexota bacterium]